MDRAGVGVTRVYRGKGSGRNLLLYIDEEDRDDLHNRAVKGASLTMLIEVSCGLVATIGEHDRPPLDLDVEEAC